MREPSSEVKIIGTQAWLIDNHLEKEYKEVKFYSQAKALVTSVSTKRHEGRENTASAKVNEQRQIKEDLMKYFGYTKEELKQYSGKSGFIAISSQLNSLLTNGVIFLTNAKPDENVRL